MNNKHPQHDDELAPLDAFEQQWVDQLAQRETDLVQTEDTFVQSVMQQAEVASAAGQTPAVIARIGKSLLPYAIAAALLLAAFVGWVALTGDTTDQPNIAKESNNPSQPDNAVAVVTPERPKVQLGKLIAQATTTSPATDLNQTVSDVNQALTVDRLFDVLGDSVPDLKEILAPLEPKNEQSRA